MPFISNKRVLEIEERLNHISNYIASNNSIITTQNGDKDGIVKEEKNKEYTKEEMKKAAFALNLCTVSISQIIDYADLNILEQEYEAILNNLNIENIPKDDSLLIILEKILDTITFFRIHEKNKEIVELEYQQKMKNGIWSAVPGLGVLIAGGNILTTAIALASQVGIGYMNYRKTKATNDFEHKKRMWELESNAIDQFNALRRELFNTTWRLAEKYKFPDKYRLSEKQIKQYNEILMDVDPIRKFQRLDEIKNSFEAYPPFWYYHGSSANAIAQESLWKAKEQENLGDIELKNDSYLEIFNAYKTIAIKSFNKFFYENGDSECENTLKFNETNKYALLREDLIASSCAMEYAELLNDKDIADRSLIEVLYKIAERYAPNEADVQQLCAMGYMRIGSIESAEKIFLKLINRNYNTITNAQLLSCLKVICYMQSTDPKKKSLCYGEYELLKSRINSNFIFPWGAENLEQLKESTEIYLDRQKAILGKKVFAVLSEIKDKYMFSFNKIIPVPYPAKYYPEEYFYNTVEAYEKRKVDIKRTLKNEKEALKYCQSLSLIDFGFNVLELMNQLLGEIKKLTEQNTEDYSFFTDSDFERITKKVADRINENKDIILNFTMFFRNEAYDLLDRFFTSKDKPAPSLWEKEIDEIFKVQYGTITGDMFNELVEIFYSAIDGIESMSLISKADNQISKWAAECNIEIPETEFFVVEKPQEEESILKLDILGDDYIIQAVDRETMETCKELIKEENLVCNRKHVQIYKEGGKDFRSYISRLNKKEINFINKDMNNIFAIIADKSFVLNSDLIFSLRGIYLKKGSIIQLLALYKDIIWDNAEMTKIKIGELTYSNKYIKLDKLVELCKNYSELIHLKDEKRVTGCEISDERFNKLFMKLQKNVLTPVSDSVKLMISDRTNFF